MSDETTPGPDLRGRIATALTEWTLTAAGGRPDAFLMPHAAAALRNNSLARADAVVATVQPELDQRDAEIKRLREELEAAGDLAGRQREDHRAEIAEAEAQIRAADAAIARVKALAEDMRTWCSPHGIAGTYAQRIEEAIEPPDLAAVREFAAKHDPRKES
jgi:hypothetical protein